MMRPQEIVRDSGGVSAPIFATTKLHDLEKLEKAAADNPRTGQPTDSDASMLLQRLKVYRFTVRLAPPERQASVPHCAHCFAQLVLNQASD